MLSSFASRLSSFGGSGNIPPAVRAAAVASGASPYEISSVDFLTRIHWAQGRRYGVTQVPGLTRGANAPNYASGGLLLEDADDAMTYGDLAAAFGLTSAVLAAGFTVVVEYVQPSSTVDGALIELHDTTSDRVAVTNEAGTNPRYFVVDGGSLQANEEGAGRTVGSVVRHAIRVEANNFRSAYDGVLTPLDDSGSLPSPVALTVGTNLIGLNPLNGTIKGIAFIARPVSDAQLQALSAL